MKELTLEETMDFVKQRALSGVRRALYHALRPVILRTYYRATDKGLVLDTFAVSLFGIGRGVWSVRKICDEKPLVTGDADTLEIGIRTGHQALGMLTWASEDRTVQGARHDGWVKVLRFCAWVSYL